MAKPIIPNHVPKDMPKKSDESHPSPLSTSLSPLAKAIADGAGDISLDDIADLKDFRISETDAMRIAQADVLEIKDLPGDPIIGHLVFRWLNPTRRARTGMKYWQWVKGELASLVRKKGIVNESVGGGAGTSVIAQGDLMLAFMPRAAYDTMREALRRRNESELDSILDKATIESGTNPEYQSVSRDVNIRTTYGQQEDD